MALTIEDSIEIFEDYDISKNDIILTHSHPDQFEKLQNGVRLYLKSFQNTNTKKTILLLATQLNQDNEIFGFSYWIPWEFYNSGSSLIDLLDVFANHFGLKVKIGNDEGYFIRSAFRFIQGRINDNDPYLLVSILAPDQIPCQLFFFASENLVGNLNRVSLFYTFALNTGKYTFWINSVPTTSMMVKAGWHDFVKTNFIEFINPNGQTKITIQKQRKNHDLSEDLNQAMTSLDVPVIYEQSFKHLLNQINNLKNDEKVIFSIAFESPKCLFCRSAEVSKEHVFPKWIRPFIKETTFDGTVFSNFGNETLDNVLKSATTKGKKESSHGFTAKLACINCNTGWMSQLENSVKHILTDNDSLKMRIESNINPADARKLSLWLTVKALLLSNKTFSNIHKIKNDVFEKLMKGEIDEGFLIEVTEADNAKFDFQVSRGLIFPGLLKLDKISSEIGKEMASNFFTCVIQLNHLLFRVSYLDKNIPLDRETTLRKTIKLFPYQSKTFHREVKDAEGQWANISKSNLEMHLFAVGILLVERKNTPK